MDPTDDIDRRHLDAIADADLFPYWYDDVDEPESNPTLVRTESCDLCVIGGGYTGLWTAIIAKERDPSRDVVLIDAAEVGSAASGRNGGFMESSLTHGIANGQERFPHELELLEQLGLENLDAIENAIHRYDIDCDFERTGVIDVATTAHPPSYLDELRDDALPAAPPRPGRPLARRRGDAGRGRLADLHRRAVAHRARRARRPGPPGVGAEDGGRAARRAHLRGHQGDVDRARRRRRAREDAARRRAGGAGRPRHERLQAAAAPAAPLHRAGLRLLHGHRAADAGAAGVDRLAPTARACRTSPTSSTTTA